LYDTIANLLDTAPGPLLLLFGDPNFGCSMAIRINDDHDVARLRELHESLQGATFLARHWAA
jgi:hypothetical protein